MMDPHSYSDLTQGTIKHIDFKLVADFETQTIQAEAYYTLDSPIDGSLYLDTWDIQIVQVEAAGQTLDWALGPVDPVLGSCLELKGLQDQARFAIKYTTAATATALQWLAPAQTAGGVYPFLFSQCQSIHARSVFPCQDTPAVRFTYTAEVVVPSPLTAVMAAQPNESWHDGDGRHFSFKMPQPIPAYLFALAIGELDSRDISPRCRIYAEPVTLPQAAWEFAETEVSLSYAEKLFGPYIWDRYDMLVLPPSFPYGGMENPRLTFLTPTLIAGDRSLTNVITHELAHSWTGNLVTNATWEDFWLNEGWTVYGERRILEAQYGTDFAGLAAAIGRRQLIMSLQMLAKGPDDSRLKRSLAGMDPERLVTTVAYEKGFAFLVALERAVGRARFDRFIADYMATFRFRSLTTEDFLEFLKLTLSGVEDLVDLNEWVYGTGLPADFPEFSSTLLDEVTEVLETTANGQLPEPETISRWNATQLELYLRSLPDTLSADESQELEKTLSLESSQNAELLASYFYIAIRAGDRAVLPAVEDFLARQGRMKFIIPLYRALVDSGWGRDLALAIFEENRERYHPIAVQKIEMVVASVDTAIS